MILLDGKLIAQNIKEELKNEISKLSKKPKLSVILVGEDPASQVYVGHKEKACAQVGMDSEVIRLSANISQSELENEIHRLNQDSDTHAILLQLPLPGSLDSFSAIAKISPEKDSDCLTPYNQGLLALGRPLVKPCTPAGVIEMLKANDIAIAGKEAVVIGRSNIVGKPMAQLLLNENATVTICHSKTVDLKEHCMRADIVVAAAGIPQLVDSSYIKEGASIIDVGIHRKEGKLIGDVNPLGMNEKAFALSPVPGGVGPMTIAGFLKNTLLLFEAQQEN
ncbi:MAG: bifunctional 5,10-methylenetetrahydrofolate dehydrogenase/5,10-methenyltetrahydrofolate cyclohydrolase [Bdellovibrionota bacterium]|nr:bifunctional 5,10-methylenetetrahydrofolate dehydrogenase/5,10-methenyltetrahydrofolate cyclohydrolase [Bdellovibrionota bacterium]